MSRGITWIASYPKSGNTWLRAFLTALLGDAHDININSLKADGIFSSREIFESYTDLDSRYLSHEESSRLLPAVYKAVARDHPNGLYIKIHDAFTSLEKGQTLIPVESTQLAFYIIRNPLDIVASLANHINSNLDEAIQKMNDQGSCLATQANNLNTNNQLRQKLLDWSGHVKSWTTINDFPVYIIRFEDMLSNPVETFKQVADAIGVNTSMDKIKRAIALSSFERLSEKESKSGFFERLPDTPTFFRKGTSGNWKNELTHEQIKSVTSQHGAVMRQFGYLN